MNKIETLSIPCKKGNDIELNNIKVNGIFADSNDSKYPRVWAFDTKNGAAENVLVKKSNTITPVNKNKK